MRTILLWSALLFTMVTTGCAQKVPDEVLTAAVKIAASDDGRVPIEGFTQSNYYTRKIADEVWQCYSLSVLRTVSDRFAYFTELEVEAQFVKRGNDWYRRIGEVKATERAKKFKEQLVLVRRTLSEGIAEKVIERDMEGVRSTFEIYITQAKSLNVDEIKNINAEILKQANRKVDEGFGALQRDRGVDRAKDQAELDKLNESVKYLDALQQIIGHFEQVLAQK